jgi:hypothetical protein
MHLEFSLSTESHPGPRWQALFERLWPHHQRWYLCESLASRPTYLQCRRAISTHMPELLPVYRRLCELAGGGDIEARFLSLYGPPAYLSSCSQAIWQGSPPWRGTTTTARGLSTPCCYAPAGWDGRCSA